MLLVYLFHGGLRRLCSSGQHTILVTTLNLVIDFEFNVFFMNIICISQCPMSYLFLTLSKN